MQILHVCCLRVRLSRRRQQSERSDDISICISDIPPASLLLLFNLSLVWEELHMQPCISTSQVREYLLKLGARRVNTQHC